MSNNKKSPMQEKIISTMRIIIQAYYFLWFTQDNIE
jgi:hypothetical protein